MAGHPLGHRRPGCRELHRGRPGRWPAARPPARPPGTRDGGRALRPHPRGGRASRRSASRPSSRPTIRPVRGAARWRSARRSGSSRHALPRWAATSWPTRCSARSAAPWKASRGRDRRCRRGVRPFPRRVRVMGDAFDEFMRELERRRRQAMGEDPDADPDPEPHEPEGRRGPIRSTTSRAPGVSPGTIAAPVARAAGRVLRAAPAGEVAVPGTLGPLVGGVARVPDSPAFAASCGATRSRSSALPSSSSCSWRAHSSTCGPTRSGIAASGSTACSSPGSARSSSCSSSGWSSRACSSWATSGSPVASSPG